MHFFYLFGRQRLGEEQRERERERKRLHLLLHSLHVMEYLLFVLLITPILFLLLLLLCFVFRLNHVHFLLVVQVTTLWCSKPHTLSYSPAGLKAEIVLVGIKSRLSAGQCFFVEAPWGRHF